MSSTLPDGDASPGVVFTFPGQGAYSYAVLRELYTAHRQTAPYFEQAHDIARELLGGDLLSLVTAASAAEHDERLHACPDLDQVGIYLSEILIAKLLTEAGVRPALLVGHSFGELAALATAGAYSFETGLRIVCHRVQALRSHARPGVMAALSCDAARARLFLEKLGGGAVEISVLNHPRQTVLSGEPARLEELSALVNQQGVSLTPLKSRYPYHSSLLADAVAPFRDALQACRYRPAAVPAYLCMEGVLYSPGADLAQLLSSQFVRQLNFQDVVHTLYGGGYRTFVECGAGEIVTKLIRQNLGPAADDVVLLPAAPQEGGLREGLPRVLGLARGQREATSAAQMLESLTLVVNDMSRLVENTSRLVGQVSASLAAQTPADSPRAEAKADEGRALPPAPAPVQPAANGNNGHAARQEAARAPRREFPLEECAETPVAIVSLGCVLPGARNPEEYWSNVLNGVSGISNLAEDDPTTGQDFLVESDGSQVKVVPDKTYTLLHGAINSVPFDAELLAGVYDREQFEALTKGQRLLALALAQSLSRMKARPGATSRVQCILGATADGSKEYDDALFVESVHTLLEGIDEPENLRRAFAGLLEEVTGYRRGDTERLTQHKVYADVAERLLGGGARTYVVDTACSSSLYSTYLGIRALQDGECDVALAGGVFAPGPANNTLFAQFRGLTHRQSRPFDADADGVVFSDGAGIVVLKRLPDALADGDRVLGVIRAVGLSSDGKSPAINVPQAQGQALAIRQAYEQSGVDVNTIQYVEAHATATIVGDAVEFKALKQTMSERDPAAPPVELGSVKALVGHTGWAAGMASVIKICKAFEAGVVPRQYNFEAPSPEIDLAGSPFNIPKTSRPWPANAAPYPRRAAINGFGFGGTNAHLILEEFDEEYHRNLCGNLKERKEPLQSLAVVGVGGLFPAAEELAAAEPSPASRFRRDALRLPAKKMLLPDVREHMDASQYLAALAAEQTFKSMPDSWAGFKNSTGVVLGLTSKTERGMRANERVFSDRLRRQLLGRGGSGTLADADLRRILDKLVESIRARNIPSGPYTLPGLMPNVTAGRVANMFDLNGPNIVIDMGDDSLLQSLLVARQLLAHDACKIVLAGGINAHGEGEGGGAEAAFLLALTTPETARKEGFNVLSHVSFSEAEAAAEVAAPSHARGYRGAQGAPEILKAVRRVREENSPSEFRRPGGPLAGVRVLFAPTAATEQSAHAAPEPRPAAKSEPQPPAKPAPQVEESRAYAFVQGTPIRYYTPQAVPAAAKGEPVSLEGRRILFLTDEPGRWSALESSGALAALNYTVVCTNGAGLANSLTADLTSEESIQSSLAGLAGVEFDTIIALKWLEGRAQETLLLDNAAGELAWLDLLFAVCRHSYERIKSKGVAVVTACQGAYLGAQLDPYTGLAAGFLKSLARELDGPVCRAVNTDEVGLYKTLRQLEFELGHAGAEVEVCYRGGARSVVTLAPVEKLSRDEHARLGPDSVVVATGGARGVTAVLSEELLRSYGCRVIALGRSDASSLPEEVRRMDEQALKDYEPQFYREGLAQGKGKKKIPELKREYLALRAAHEVYEVTNSLQALPGQYEYRSIDINNAAAVEETVADVYRKYGRVDLVLHGAGVQISNALPKKSLADFRRIVNTKLSGLGHLYRACKKHGRGRAPDFHILTSAFSYLGNDGQPDYGAANEAMARLADCLDAQEGRWSSMAWLGWAGIGMTRDSEFAALAASRRLRGVTKEEGQQIFSELMKGTPTTPVNVLLADGEIEYYKVAIQAAPYVPPPAAANGHGPANGRKDFHVVERDITVESAPYLLNHLVDGIPTLPGALVIALFAEAAQQLRPALKIVSFEQAHFRRFVKVFRNRKTHLRVEAEIVSEDERQTVVRVRILSDFVHSSGLVLQKDIVQHEIIIRMSPALEPAPRSPDPNGFAGRTLYDPYLSIGSPVRLSGPFNAMENIVIGETRRRAEFKMGDTDHAGTEYEPVLSKVVLMDSLWRFGVIHPVPDKATTVFVPEECRVMKVFFDFSDFDLSTLPGTLTFSGANPRLDGDRLTIGPVFAADAAGNTLLLVEDGICLRYGKGGNGASN
ncbi:MAG: SDR family NAD(P)-dependent oxidoreductase [Acidobacteria bacterium]|nr:SDR family NAD(P)-dependent oxidoreductase [Acidobacteriota bacterium]